MHGGHDFAATSRLAQKCGARFMLEQACSATTSITAAKALEQVIKFMAR